MSYSIGEHLQPHYRNFDHNPQPPDEFVELDQILNKGVTLRLVMSDDIFSGYIQYPIIVEMWEKVAGRYAGGKKKQAYLATFTEQERRTLSRYHTLFYRWYLITGCPNRVACKTSTLELLTRAVNFFATV